MIKCASATGWIKRLGYFPVIAIAMPALACEWRVSVDNLETSSTEIYLPVEQFILVDSVQGFRCAFHMPESVLANVQQVDGKVTIVCSYPEASVYATDGNEITTQITEVKENTTSFLILSRAKQIFKVRAVCD